MGHFSEFIFGLIPGAFAGAMYVIIAQPLDEINFKMEYFSQDYKNRFDCFIKTIKREGVFRGLYSGAILNLYIHMIENATLFAMLPYCAKGVRFISMKQPYEEFTLLEKSLSGSLAAFFTSFLHCPGTVLSTTMQEIRYYEHAHEQKHYKAIKRPIGRHVLILSIIREKGFYNLYNRLCPIMLREMYGVFFYFGGFYGCRDLIDIIFQPEEIGFIQVMLSGGMGGAAYHWSVHPIAIVHARMKTNFDFWPIVYDILRTNGIRGFYSGLGSILLRAVPTSAFLFGAVSTLDDYLFYS